MVCPLNFEPVGYTAPKLLTDAIILMERNLEEPLKILEIASYLEISQRQLERLFQRHTGDTPLRYYINISLDRARGLVTQTEMPIAKIANACGYNSAEQFPDHIKNVSVLFLARIELKDAFRFNSDLILVMPVLEKRF